MKLYTTSAWYNPYYVNVNDKAYRISEIHVFDENGEICHIEHGWFGSNNEHPRLELPCECVRKMKIDYGCKTAFVIKSECQYSPSETMYALYLPDAIVNIGDPTYLKDSMGYLIETRVSKNYDFMVFDKYHNDFVSQMYNKRNVFEEIVKKIQSMPLHDLDDKLIMEIDTLRAVAIDYIRYKDYVKNMTVAEMVNVIIKN